MKHSEYSELKVFYHMDRIEKLLKNQRVAPVYVRLKPTNVCNQKCYYCVYADDIVFKGRKVKHKDYICWDKMQEILNDFESMGVKAVTLSGGGEPLCYKYILETLEYLQKSTMDYSVITNAQALEGEIAEMLVDAKWIRISIDAANSKTYKEIRRVDTFEHVIENISHFSEIKNKNCTVGINFVVTQDNYLQVYEMCQLAKKIQLNNLKFSPLLGGNNVLLYQSSKMRKNVEEQLLKAKRELQSDNFVIIDKYTNDLGLQNDFEKQYQNCIISQLFTVVGADLKIYFCHQRAYMEEGIVGDISKQSFKEVWFSEETTQRLKMHNVSEKCNFRCVFEERNILLNQFFDLDRNHVNFI